MRRRKMVFVQWNNIYIVFGMQGKKKIKRWLIGKWSKIIYFVTNLNATNESDLLITQWYSA